MNAGGLALAFLGTLIVVQVLGGQALQRLQVVPS